MPDRGAVARTHLSSPFSWCCPTVHILQNLQIQLNCFHCEGVLGRQCCLWSPGEHDISFEPAGQELLI